MCVPAVLCRVVQCRDVHCCAVPCVGMLGPWFCKLSLRACLQKVLPSFPAGRPTRKAHLRHCKRYRAAYSRPECTIIDHDHTERHGHVQLSLTDNVQDEMHTAGAVLRESDMITAKGYMRGSGVGANLGAVELSGLSSGSIPVTELQQRIDLMPCRDAAVAQGKVASGELREGLSPLCTHALPYARTHNNNTAIIQ